ncbi:MAG: HD-GYP domain-containing protein [Chloroflexota bacterium]
MEAFVLMASAIALGVVIVYAWHDRRRGGPVRLMLRGVGLVLAFGVLAGLSVVTRMLSGSDAYVMLSAAVLAGVALILPFVLGAEARREQQLRLTRRAATILMPPMALPSLLDRALDLAHAAVKVDGSSIMLLDPSTRELRFAATRGIDYARAQIYRVSLDNPAIAAVWSGEGPIIVPDVAKAPAFRRLLVRAELRSFFAIPMVVQDTLVGFLNVHRLRPSHLSVDDLQVLTVLASQAAVAIQTANLYADLQQRYLDTVSALASAVEINDPSTLGHCRRVAYISRLLAGELGLESEAREALEVTALLHDVGKLGVEEAVLHKAGLLTPEEVDAVRLHAEMGATVLRDVEALRSVAPAILHHHEWWDGSGYPTGLKGAEVPLAARIVSVADAYEVMTAGRPYRAARSAESALAEIKRMAGRQFDPVIVDALVRLHDSGYLPLPTEMRPREAERSAAS